MSQVACEDGSQNRPRQAKALTLNMKFTTLFRRQIAPNFGSTAFSRDLSSVLSRPAPVAPQSLAPLAVSTPAAHGRVALYLLHAPAVAPVPGTGAIARPMLPLAEALRDGLALLHETAGLHETEIENLAGVDLFAQAGETIHGGWMDRTLAVDLIVPACHERPRRVGLRAFCLEPGGCWRLTDQREVSRAFGAAATSALILDEDDNTGSAAGSGRRRRWRKQPRLSARLASPGGGAAVCRAHRAGSARQRLCLRDRRRPARGACLFVARPVSPALAFPARRSSRRAAGRRGESGPTAPRPPVLPPRIDEVIAWLDRARRGRHVAQSLTPRVTLSACESADGTVSLETLDTAQGHVCVHRWVVTPAPAVR